MEMRTIKKIYICESNLALGTEEVKEKLEKSGEFDVNVEGCLGYCGECCEQLYVLLDGEFISGETAEELLEEINKRK